MLKKYLKYFLVIFLSSSFILILKDVSFAQSPDPKSIKFKYFYPPTLSPIPTATITPTPSPTIVIPTITQIIPTVLITPTPTIYWTPPAGGQDCYEKGLGLYNPQVPALLTSLCSDGSIAPTYQENFIPDNLVNLQYALGGDYWVRDNTILIKNVPVETLRGFLDYLKGINCIPMIAYGYRSYAFQQDLWVSRGCQINPSCGVAPAGYSTHQAGVTVDLFCSSIDMQGRISISAIPREAIDNSIYYNLIHPIIWDTPHFIIL